MHLDLKFSTLELMPYQSSEKKGFTLIELLVVISIIAVLTTIGLISYSKAQIYARDTRRKNDLKSLQTALEIYYQKNSFYPTGDGSRWCTYISNPSFTQVTTALTPNFINTIPSDPSYPGVSKDYFYGTNDSKSYDLYATLENSSDPTPACSTNSNPCFQSGIEMSDFPGGCAGQNNAYNYRLTPP